MNYFELFGLPVSPVVDPAVISKKYFRLQREFHPDFFSKSTEEEMGDASRQSAAINNAYKIFQDPERTLGYFLEIKGVMLSDEKYELPPEFLMEVMEINESLQDEGEEKAAEKVAEFENLLEQEVQPYLTATDNLSSAGLETLKSYYYKRKYLRRILDRMAD